MLGCEFRWSPCALQRTSSPTHHAEVGTPQDLCTSSTTHSAGYFTFPLTLPILSISFCMAKSGGGGGGGGGGHMYYNDDSQF